MANVKIYTWALRVAGFCLIAALGMAAVGSGSQAGPFLISFFLALGIGFRGFPRLKGFSFTVMILGVVTTALYYPSYFIEVNGFDTSALIVPLLQIIMFGMGATVSIKAFIGVIKQPKGVILGFILQFTIMPLVGFILASQSGFPPEIAAGIILVGCSPSGLASNVMAYLGRGNVPLSLTITSVNTLFAPIMTPVLMALFAGTFIEINTISMMWSIMNIVILPVTAGVLFNEFLSDKAKWVDDVLPLLSMAGIAVIILITSALGRDGLMDLGLLLFLLVLIHNVTGYILGYWSARLFKMNETDCRTLAIEVGMQNAGLGKGIAQEMGRLATLGLAPLVFGPLMNVTGSMLAMYWHDHVPEDALDLAGFVEARNRFSRSMIDDGIFSPEQLNSRWTEEIIEHFLTWVNQQSGMPGYSRAQLIELMGIVTDYAIKTPRKFK